MVHEIQMKDHKNSHCIPLCLKIIYENEMFNTEKH